MGNRIKVAAIQMNCLMTGKEDNLKLAADLIERAGQAGAKVIVLPELFSTAYRVEERDYALSEPIPGPTTDWMQSWCKKYDAYLMGAIIERGDVDGVLVIPHEIAQTCIERALEKAAGEKLVRKAIEGGMSATEAFKKFGIL